MSKNYKFRINPPPPSREEMAKHKDFEALLQRYESVQKRNQARIRRMRTVYISGAIAASVAVVLILLGGVFSAPEAPQLSAEAYFEQQPFASPPIEALAAPQFASFTVDTEKGGAYEYPSGSKLVVPASAFANDYGRLIEGEVTVYYREMHDFVDFFSAGIPMQYDSASLAYNLQSIGMIEIYAEQNGQPVKLLPKKSIDIELYSEVFVSGAEEATRLPYQLYRLDTIISNWRYQGNTTAEMLPGTEVVPEDPLFAQKQALMKDLQALERRKQEAVAMLESRIPQPVKPLRPQPAEGDFATLELDFLDGQLQIEDTENGRVKEELAQLQRMYENVIWKISPNSPAFDERAFGVEWEAARIRPLNQRDYELTLVHPQNELTLIVTPVLFGADYDRALDRYSQELQDYQLAMESREAKLKAARDSITQQAAAEEEAVIAAYDEQVETLKATGTYQDDGNRYLVRRKVVSRFAADKLGVWNCARPEQLPQQALTYDFKDQNGKAYNSHTAYLVNYGSNTLQRFYTGGKSMPALQADRQQLLWLVTDDQRIAVLPPEELQAVNTDEARTLRLNLLDQRITAEADVRALLHF